MSAFDYFRVSFSFGFVVFNTVVFSISLYYGPSNTTLYYQGDRLSLVIVVSFQVKVSAKGWSFAQRSPTHYVCVSLSVIRWNNSPLHLQWVSRKRSKLGRKEKEERKNERKKERNIPPIKFLSQNIKANSQKLKVVQIRTSEVSVFYDTPHPSPFLPSLLSLELVCVNFLPRCTALQVAVCLLPDSNTEGLILPASRDKGLVT